MFNFFTKHKADEPAPIPDEVIEVAEEKTPVKEKVRASVDLGTNSVTKGSGDVSGRQLHSGTDDAELNMQSDGLYSKPLTVRIRPYTGVELKTLWNHFNKDDLITDSELSGLLERIFVKDSTDMFADLKRTLAWKKFGQSASKLMDASNSGMVDLSKFNSGFNDFNTNRFYYVIKYILPECLTLLKAYSKEMNLSGDKLIEFGLDPNTSNPIDMKRIKQLEFQVSQLQTTIAAREKDIADANTSEEKKDALVASLREKNDQLENQMKQSKENGSQELVRLRDANEKLEEQILASKQRNDLNANNKSRNQNQEFEKQVSDLKQQLQQTNESNVNLGNQNADLQKQVLELKQKLETVGHNINSKGQNPTNVVKQIALPEKAVNTNSLDPKVIADWKRAFDDVIAENNTLRQLLAESKSQIDHLDNDFVLIGKKMHDLENQHSNSSRPNTIFGAALTGSDLDPLRKEILRKFGTFDNAFMNFDTSPSSTARNRSPPGPRRITMGELELLALSMGYTKAYSKKLFYALDTRNRGFLSLDQFSKTLPVINKEFVLLTKDIVQNMPGDPIS